MAYRECDNCGLEYKTGNEPDALQISARFCSDKCRYDSANDKKKLLRGAKSVVSRMADIRNISKASNNQQTKAIAERCNEAIVEFALHGDVVLFEDAIQAMTAGLSLKAWRLANKPPTMWQCRKCGQLDSAVNNPDRCSNCGHDVMLPIAPML